MWKNRSWTPTSQIDQINTRINTTNIWNSRSNPKIRTLRRSINHILWLSKDLVPFAWVKYSSMTSKFTWLMVNFPDYFENFVTIVKILNFIDFFFQNSQTFSWPRITLTFPWPMATLWEATEKIYEMQRSILSTWSISITYTNQCFSNWSKDIWP